MKNNIIRMLMNKDNLEMISTLLNEEYNNIKTMEDMRFGHKLFDLMVEVNTYLQDI